MLRMNDYFNSVLSFLFTNLFLMLPSACMFFPRAVAKFPGFPYCFLTFATWKTISNKRLELSCLSVYQ